MHGCIEHLNGDDLVVTLLSMSRCVYSDRSLPDSLQVNAKLQKMQEATESKLAGTLEARATRQDAGAKRHGSLQRVDVLHGNRHEE